MENGTRGNQSRLLHLGVAEREHARANECSAFAFRMHKSENVLFVSASDVRLQIVFVEFIVVGWHFDSNVNIYILNAKRCTAACPKRKEKIVFFSGFLLTFNRSEREKRVAGILFITELPRLELCLEL